AREEHTGARQGQVQKEQRSAGRERQHALSSTSPKSTARSGKGCPSWSLDFLCPSLVRPRQGDTPLDHGAGAPASPSGFLLPLDLGAQALLLHAQLRRELLAKVLRQRAGTAACCAELRSRLGVHGTCTRSRAVSNRVLNVSEARRDLPRLVKQVAQGGKAVA